MSDRPRVLALVHLPPPVHGASLMGQQLVDGSLGSEVELRVLPLRFARDVGDLGTLRPAKALTAIRVVVAQGMALAGGGIRVGYITAAMGGAPLVRDAIYMHLFRLFRVPYLVHFQGMGVAPAVARMPAPARALVRTALRRARTVIALTEMHARELARVVEQDRVAVVPNAVPDLPPVRSADLRHPRRGRTGGRLLFLSNMHPDKGPFELLEALPRILRARPDATATFAGAWADAVTRDRFAARAAELGVNGHIEVRGAVGPAEKERLLAAADLLVFPSYYALEGSPLVVLEGMRQGLAIVATRHAAIPDILGDAAVLVPPRDAAALAAAVVRLLGEPDEVRRLGAAARERYEREHRTELWDARLAALLKRAAAPQARVARDHPHAKVGPA